MPAIIQKLMQALHLDSPAPPPPPAESGESAAAVAVPDSTEATETDTAPTFSSDDVSVIFVLGGPGAGKGTQCAKLVDDYGFVHLSAGDLLRAEQQREGSQYGSMIREHIKEGIIVPMHVTVALLQDEIGRSFNATDGESKSKSKFLVDGFPRKMDQALKFDESVCKSQFVLFLTCPEDKLLERLRERGKTSGRDDDNEESIKKRFRTFVETSMPVVDYYREKGRVVEIDSSSSVDEVYASIREQVEKRLNVSRKSAAATTTTDASKV